MRPPTISSRRSPTARGVAVGWLATTFALVVLAGCSGGSSDSEPRSDGGHTTSAPSTTGTTTAPTSSPTSTSATSTSAGAPPKRPVTIAFAGDIHFADNLAARLEHPKTAIGPMRTILANADLAIANLETAVTTRGIPQPKEYRFRAPPVAFTALKDAGIDVATMANNHALDYGPVSVPDALAAAKARNFPVVGIGRNAAQAFAPWIATVHGQRIAFFGATAVLDAPLVSSWSATDTQAGVAAAIDGNNAELVSAVEKVRPDVDTIVVDLHYGSDLLTCPTEIQQNLAHDLVDAGADVIVGQHAHVPLGGGYLGSSYVEYGMGNFEFYAPTGSVTAQTGVLVVTVDGRRVAHPRWIPGTIVGGLPVRLHGAAAVAAQDHWQSMRACAGLTTRPSS